MRPKPVGKIVAFAAGHVQVSFWEALLGKGLFFKFAALPMKVGSPAITLKLRPCCRGHQRFAHVLCLAPTRTYLERRPPSASCTSYLETTAVILHRAKSVRATGGAMGPRFLAFGGGDDSHGPPQRRANHNPDEAVPRIKRWAPKVRTGCITCRFVVPFSFFFFFFFLKLFASGTIADLQLKTPQDSFRDFPN